MKIEIQSIVLKTKEQIKKDKSLKRLTKDYKKRKRLRRHQIKKFCSSVRKLSLKKIKIIEKKYIDSFVPF